MMNRYLQSGCGLAGVLMLALSAGCAGSPKHTGSSGHLPGWPATGFEGGTNAPVLAETDSADAGGESRGAGTLTGAAPDTFQEFWRDPEFVKRFMGGYGFQADIEPKFQSPEEEAFY
ncbi:MAG TPA: hypothetical protein VMS21_05985, partial [Methylomirabilota bacterium]|nr:hypothetical protein [Methylomirabilota bacterium]